MANEIRINDLALKKRLAKMQSNLNNGSPVMKKTAIIMQKDVLDHFQKESAPTGKWKSTKRGGKILQDTGRLRNSIRARSTKNDAIIGSNVVYAATQNYGRGAIASRRFLWISDNAKKLIAKTLGKFYIAD